MAILLRMPEISANTVEAVLAEWPLRENAAFAAGDAIATVETEKAVVDVPAESAGVLLRTLIEPGRSVPVGTPMAVLGAPGETVDDLDGLVEELTGEPRPAAAEGAAGRIFASPLARRMARENGLAIADIQGTGPGGRIVRDDVRRALVAHRGRVSGGATSSTAELPTGAASRPAVATAAAAERPTADGARPAVGAVRPTVDAATVPAPSGPADESGYQDIPHSRMRRAIADRLSRSSRETPVFSIRGSARVDALLALRDQLNEAAAVRISVNDLIVAAAARAHVVVPEMNVVWTPDAVRRFRDVDISVAVATDAGLVTPVVRGVPGLTLSALAARTADLLVRARAGRLRQEELEGGTLTVTNLGTYGTEDFTAVINPPQAAILAVGAARQEAVVTDGELGVATVLRVTLSVDHRPVDGATAARWMAAFLALLEAPVRILV